MIKRFSTNYAIFSMVLDSLLVMVALEIAKLIRPSMDILSTWIKDLEVTPPISPYLFIVFAITWVIVFIQFDVYNPEKHLRAQEECSNHLFASLTATAIIAGILYLTDRELSRVLFISFCILATLLLYSHRLLYRVIVKGGILSFYKQQRILIVGAGIVGRRFEEEINIYQSLGLKIIGFVDDDHDLNKTSPDVLGNLRQTADIIQKHQIDNLVIALPRRAYDRIEELIREVEKLPVRVWVIPDYFALTISHANVVNFADFPLIDLRSPALNSVQRFIKRIFDLILVIPFTLLSLPLIGIIALIIKLDSPGPIFYFSPRIRENGETFKMIKFRTMVDGADKNLRAVLHPDENGNLIHKYPDDPRVTSVGHFLRKFSLDELPQLIHVIQGDMSFVGPRPELPELVDRYESWQRKRFAVPQGLTGWWQVNGRSDKPMHLHTEDDLYYIQNYSLWLDIQILLKTVWTVLRGKGAY